MISSSSSAQASKLRLAVLLLAAGEGNRLGVHPKALLIKEDQTLLQRFAMAVQGFSPVEFIVVTGFHSQAIESAIAGMNISLAYPMRIIQNPIPEKGQPSSVRMGLESLRREFDVLLVALSDQPEIGSEEIQELLNEYVKREGDKEVILPMVEGQRGNPVLFSRRAVLNVLDNPGMVCRAYMDAHPEKLGVLHTSNQAFVMDVDTPADIQRHKLSLN
jgi:molybdenum cofactor cytidylyltransferase